MNRIEKLKQLMSQQNVSQLIITDPSTIFYYTGEWIHPGERMLVLLVKLDAKPLMIINQLFPIQGNQMFDVVQYDDTDDNVKLLTRYLSEKEMIGIDKNWPAAFLLRLMSLLPTTKLMNGSQITDAQRAIKDEDEINRMRAASIDNDTAMRYLYDCLLEGLSEKEMTVRLEEKYAALGNSGMSFEPIVAYGVNAAAPHHETDNTFPKVGDCAVFDIGGIKDDYCSDMTRTVFYKTVSEEHQKVYEIVKEANMRAIEAVKPGVTLSSIDAAARDYIKKAGYGEFFTHRTGHFIGIDVHEADDVSAANDNLTRAGMIFSIEPGIYLTNDVGVRVEDLVLVTENGVEVLNKVSKELTVID